MAWYENLAALLNKENEFPFLLFPLFFGKQKGKSIKRIRVRRSRPLTNYVRVEIIKFAPILLLEQEAAGNLCYATCEETFVKKYARVSHQTFSRKEKKLGNFCNEKNIQNTLFSSSCSFISFFFLNFHLSFFVMFHSKQEAKRRKKGFMFRETREGFLIFINFHSEVGGLGI